MINGMYAAFVRHNIMPSDYYKASPTERAIIATFIQVEIEAEQEAIKKAKKK